MAAAVTFRHEPTRREKAIWVFVFLLLMCSEVWMMSKDRYQHDKDQAQAAREQADHFQAIADGISHSAADIAATLEATRITFGNTQPKAVLAFQSFSPAFEPLVLGPNARPIFNVLFSNIGSENATRVFYDGMLYVDKLDDLEAQKRLAHEFDMWWKTSKHLGGGETIAASSAQGLFSFQSPQFTEAELKGLDARTVTIYVFLRFIYSDHNGRWVNDVCFGLQDPKHDMVVSHPCKLHDNPRYPIKQP